MKLTAARVQNYRSIVDSKWVGLAPLSALVGMNEAGKTNFLLALKSFNTGEEYSWELDAPRSAEVEPDDDNPVVSLEFELEQEDLDALNDAGYAPAKDAMLRVTKTWAGAYRWELPNAPAKRMRSLDTDRVEVFMDAFNGTRKRLRERLVKAMSTSGLVEDLTARRPANAKPADFETYITKQLTLLRRAVSEADMGGHRETQYRNRLEEFAEELPRLVVYPEPPASAREVLTPNLPEFAYFADFGEVTGDVNLAAYVKYQEDPEKFEESSLERVDLSERFRTIRNLFELLDVRPEELVDMNRSRRAVIESRLQDRAQSLICEGWVQDIRVRIRLDGHHAMVMVADLCDGEILGETELRHRSRGFRTFFSFFINCGAAVKHELRNTVLLLDEPGLHLHADQQTQFMNVLKGLSAVTPCVYTTHSPWMLPPDALNGIKALEKNRAGTTTVSSRWWAKSRDASLAIRRFIGITQGESLVFPTKRCLVAVEGVSDAIYLQTISEAFSKGDAAYQEKLSFAFRPAGGAPQLPTQVAAAKTEPFEAVLMLVDNDPAGRDAQTKVTKAAILEPTHVVNVAESGRDPKKDAEIEDLLPRSELLRVVNALLKEQGVPKAKHITRKQLNEAMKASRQSRVWPVLSKMLRQRKPAREIDKTTVAEKFAHMWMHGTIKIVEATYKSFAKLFEAFWGAAFRPRR